MLFPETFGTKVANEILLTDRALSAKDAVQFGFANGIIDGVDKVSEFFAPDKIPALKRLLSYDIETIQWNMRELVKSKDMENIEKVSRREAAVLVSKWEQPGFMEKMAAYMANVRKGKTTRRAKM